MSLENNRKNRFLLILFIVFVAYSVLAFVIPFRRGAVFWVAYLFTVAAIVLQVVIFEIAFGKADSLRRTFLGIPIAKLGIIYLAVQLPISAGLMIRATFVPFMPVWIAIVLCVIVQAVIAVIIIFSDAVRIEIDRIETAQVISTGFIAELRADLNSLLPRITDNDLKQRVEKLSEAVRYSDPVSNEGLAVLEAQIGQCYASLRQAVKQGGTNEDADTGAAVDEMSFLIEERHQKCKALKRQLEHPV